MAQDVLPEAVVIEVASVFHFVPGLLDQGVVDDPRAAGPATSMLIEAEAVHRLRRPGVPMQEAVQVGLVTTVDGSLGHIHDVLLTLAVQGQAGQHILHMPELRLAEEFPISLQLIRQRESSDGVRHSCIPKIYSCQVKNIIV